ncbi:MAG: hypothetical protein SGBAC_000688 [Bacillariaceae sp.]
MNNNNDDNITNTTSTQPNLRGSKRQRMAMDDVHPAAGNEEAYGLVGILIRIGGEGGRLCAKKGKITTGYRVDPAEFIIEAVTPENSTNKQEAAAKGKNRRLVSFRLKDTNLFLSQNPYGDVAQAEALKSISSLPILPEISQQIVDFAVGQENNNNNNCETGEGAGFDYRSMQLEEGPPGLLQQFSLEGEGLRKVGIKTVYGKYWRAPSWSKNVLQSPHQEGDETFWFSPV